MSHEAILYGRILGQERGRGGAGFLRIRDLQRHNRRVIKRLPREDLWPGLCRGMFAFPAWPHGVFRTPIITFGGSFKDDPSDYNPQLPRILEGGKEIKPLRASWKEWFDKFEALLRRLYWWSAVVLLATDFEGQQLFRWTPTEQALDLMFADAPVTIGDWVRTVQQLDGLMI